MSEKLKIGLIGCGAIGEKRLHAIRATGRGEIVGVADVFRERAERLAFAFGAEVCSPQAILQTSAINVAIVSTPNRFLAEYGEMALAQAKHVLLEKPGAISRDQISRMLAVQKSAPSKPLCKIGYNHRFHPAAMKIKQELRNDDCGRILWIRGAYGHGGRPGYEKEWRFQNELSGGGEIIDQGVHLLDLLSWWLSEPLAVRACLRQNAFYPSSEEDNGYLLLEANSGVVAYLHCSATQWKNLFRVEIATENALLVWNGLGSPNYGNERLTIYRRNPKGGKPDETVHRFDDMDISLEAEWRHFCDCIERDTPDDLSVKAENRPAPLLAGPLLSPLAESLWIFEVLREIYHSKKVPGTFYTKELHNG